MRIERRVLGRRGQHLVALPASVRKHLGTVPGGAVYLHVTAAGQVALTTTGQARGGRPRSDVDCPSCDARERELVKLRQRDVARDRTLYAEGHTAGFIAAQERLLRPVGPSAERDRRRRLASLHLPVGRRGRRQTIAVPAPALEAPASPSPSPADASGGAGTSGGEATQVPHHDESGAGTVPGTA